MAFLVLVVAFLVEALGNQLRTVAVVGKAVAVAFQDNSDLLRKAVRNPDIDCNHLQMEADLAVNIL